MVHQAQHWIWQQKGWPNVTFDAVRVLRPAGDARRAQGLVAGAMSAITDRDRRQLLAQALTDEAVTTSQIEGETLDPASVRRSIERRLRLDPNAKPDRRRREARATEGMAAVTVDAVEHAANPLTTSRLLRWHRMLSPSGLAADQVGSFRTSEIHVEPGPIGRETIHFVAPPPGRVEHEVDGFLLWLATAESGDRLITAALSHLIFVTIHPFADGNGRISRAIADLLLARDVGNEISVSMTRQILAERQDYYTVLERTQRNGLDVTDWLLWFLGCYERAALHTLDVVREVEGANRIFARAAQRGLNERQAGVLRVFLDRYEGRLNPAKYAQIAAVSKDTAQRDLADLVEKRVLERSGATSNVSYVVAPDIAEPAIPLRPARPQMAADTVPPTSPRRRNEGHSAVAWRCV
ncbi:MAG TPA: Fic family protein [Candidatus Elarobacter sp.]|nr:Fic family protein [Candidatus Elarobacter sp.]